MFIPGLVIGIPSVTPTTLIVSLILTFLTLCVGHSVGLHRGIIHRTYETGRVVKGTLAYLFVLSGLGGPISWARLHAIRDFWQNRSDCPRYFAYGHSIARDFIWNLHLRFEPVDDRADNRLPADVLHDPWLQFLERTWPLHILVLAIAIRATMGPGAVAVCVCARTAASILGHWGVGYAAHAWGERRFILPGAAESGTNVWILGLLSFGEGFHNNHHAFPTSARMGMRSGEFDLGWLVIRVLERLSLVRRVCAWHRASDRFEKTDKKLKAVTDSLLYQRCGRLHGKRSRPLVF
jgi:stearoyl-CoA desaturase (delta-9 desaturase)